MEAYSDKSSLRYLRYVHDRRKIKYQSGAETPCYYDKSKTMAFEGEAVVLIMQHEGIASKHSYIYSCYCSNTR